MRPPDPPIADGFNVPQEYDGLVFLIRGAAVSLSFQVHRPQVLVEASLTTFSDARFEFTDDGPDEAQHDSLANIPKSFASHLHGLSKVAAVGFCA